MSIYWHNVKQKSWLQEVFKNPFKTLEDVTRVV